MVCANNSRSSRLIKPINHVFHSSEGIPLLQTLASVQKRNPVGGGFLLSHWLSYAAVSCILHADWSSYSASPLSEFWLVRTNVTHFVAGVWRSEEASPLLLSYFIILQAFKRNYRRIRMVWDNRWRPINILESLRLVSASPWGQCCDGLPLISGMFTVDKFPLKGGQ